MILKEKQVEKHVSPSNGTMNKGGRPKVALKRDKIIALKCNGWEKKAVLKKAKLTGKTTSEFLRGLALKEEVETIKKTLPKEILELFAGFRHTGSNLNQIARRLNMDDPLTSYLREQLLYHVSELEKIEEKIKIFFQ